MCNEQTSILVLPAKQPTNIEFHCCTFVLNALQKEYYGGEDDDDDDGDDAMWCNAKLLLIHGKKSSTIAR